MSSNRCEIQCASSYMWNQRQQTRPMDRIGNEYLGIDAKFLCDLQMKFAERAKFTRVFTESGDVHS